MRPPQLHVEVHGTSGDPVLLVMGFCMTGAMWAPMVPGLAARHQVATFDHRGLGASEDGPQADTMAALADDAKRVLDSLGWSSAHVVGVSMGGMIAQELTLTHPERVRTLTLIATHAGGRFAAVPPLAGWLALLTPAPRAERLQRLLYPSSYRQTADLHERTSAQIAQRVPSSTARAQLRAVVGHDTRARLVGLRRPTLVVKPALDALCRPSHADDLMRRIPGARLIVLPDAGHGLIVQEPQLLVERILEHLGRRDQNSTFR